MNISVMRNSSGGQQVIMLTAAEYKLKFIISKKIKNKKRTPL